VVRKDGLDADVRAADELAHGPDDARVIDEHSRRPARHRALGEGQRGRVALDPGDLVADRGDLGSCGMGRVGASGAQCQSGGVKTQRQGKGELGILCGDLLHNMLCRGRVGTSGETAARAPGGPALR
jgi:hypothetical protein